MGILIDANMPRPTAARLRARQIEAVDVREIGLADAADSVIASVARDQKLAILTRDFDFADVRNYPPELYAGIIVLALPNTWTADVVLGAVDALINSCVFVDPDRKLIIVEPGRIRIRLG